MRARRLMSCKKAIKRRKRMLISEWSRKISKYIEVLKLMLEIYKPRVRSIGYYYRSGTVGANLLKLLNARFNAGFRISHEQFIWICNELRADLEIKPNILSHTQKKATVEEKVAITIYKLKSCCEYQAIGNIFGYSKSTVHKIFYEVIKAAIKRLTPKHIQFPNAHECQDISTKFARMCGIPQIIDAIDGTHIPVTVTSEGRKDFVNRKGWTSIVLLAVVDDTCRFRDISCIFPGNVHDATVLRRSQLYKDYTNIFPKSEYIYRGR